MQGALTARRQLVSQVHHSQRTHNTQKKQVVAGTNYYLELKVKDTAGKVPPVHHLQSTHKHTNKRRSLLAPITTWR